MQCPQCRHENPAGQKFCGECGARLVVVCRACQAANPPANKFYGECGAKLGADAAAPAAAPGDGGGTARAAPAAPPASAERFASPESYTPKHLAEKILTSRGAVEGERKMVTVLFADVSGFTAMSERLDPEEVHAIMDRAFEVILDAVHLYEGTVNQFLGDGVMALFGAPIAHEDHAQRALKAALMINEGLRPLAADIARTRDIEFRMRMGINTGPVVVGAIGKDLRMDYTAVGDTTNLAARLLTLAKPGQIVVSRGTQHLRTRSFEFEDLGEFEVKGKSAPVRAYALKAERPDRARLEATAERGLTALVGRERELERLRHALGRAVDGNGAVVLIVGDAGVGKSRLLYEFLTGVDRDEILELDVTCASYGRATPFRPVVELLRRCLSLSEGSTPAEFVNRLSGGELRQRTFGAVRDLLLALSRHVPLILLIESSAWGPELRRHVRDQFGRWLGIRVYCEQLPDRRNAITLSGLRDYFGSPAPHLQTSIGGYERRALDDARVTAMRLMTAMGLTDIHTTTPTFAAHQVRTHRMGSDPLTSVVDSDLKAHDVPNLYLVGSGSFVTASASPPTLTIAALAARAAEHIAARLGKGTASESR